MNTTTTMQLSSEPAKTSAEIKHSTTSSQTSRTAVESSEEFTLSGELTVDGAPPLQLSNMVVVQEQQRKVKFAAEPYFITEEDVFVPLPIKKKSKSKKKITEEEEQPEVIRTQDIWWSPEEREA